MPSTLSAREAEDSSRKQPWHGSKPGHGREGETRSETLSLHQVLHSQIGERDGSSPITAIDMMGVHTASPQTTGAFANRVETGNDISLGRDNSGDLVGVQAATRAEQRRRPSSPRAPPPCRPESKRLPRSSSRSPPPTHRR